MSEFDELTLREAFARFHTESLSAVPAQNFAGVRTIARRRRTTRTAAVGAAAALVLAVPVSAYALGHRTDGPPPAVQPAPSESASASPAQSASPSAEPSLAPDGKISLTDLGNATLDIPAWPASGMQCDTKRQKFTDGQTSVPADGHAHTMIKKVAYADVDDDGAQETIALLTCFIQGGDEQVAVFDRDADGNIVTLGQVVAEDTSIQNMFDVRGEADGSVSVQVGDLHTCCGVTPDQAFHQWRRYAWDGRRFRQVSGPTAFPKRSDFAVTATDVHLGPVSNGMRHGTTTVIVRNVGPATAHDVGPVPAVTIQLTISPEFGGSAQSVNVDPATIPGACHPDTGYPAADDHLTCGLKPLAPGQSTSVTFHFTSLQENDPVILPAPNWNVEWNVAIDTRAANGTPLLDGDGTNNLAKFKINRVD